MRKARTSPETVRQSLIKAAEKMLQETGGRRLVMSEVAARVGLTQSHAHSFFATKNDLVRALAQQWFDEVETELKSALHLPGPPIERLKIHVLTILRIKRAKFDEDPELFNAYLFLASEHKDIIATHAARLHAMLVAIVATMVPPGEIESASQMVHDATVLFRVPHNIAMFRTLATDERAHQVLDALAKVLSPQSSGK